MEPTRRSFTYLQWFDESWRLMGLTDDDLITLENILLANPEKGDIVKGTGGARKIRIQVDKNRGKSKGGRVIYVDFCLREKLYLIYAYPKSRQSDLTPEQKNMIRTIIEEIEKE